MKITIQNQKSVILQTNALDTLPVIDPTLDLVGFTEQRRADFRARYVDPLYQPINANRPVVIQDEANPANPIVITADMLDGGVEYLWGNPVLDVTLQQQIAEIYRKGIQYHAPNDGYFEQQLGIEALTRLRLPVPTSKGSQVVKYTASLDIIPAAKGFLSTPDEANARAWFANLTGYTYERTEKNFLLATVRTGKDFDQLKAHIKTIVNGLQQNVILPLETNQILADLDKIDLSKELSTGWFLPMNGFASGEQHEAYSFSRILLYAMATFEKSHTNANLTIQPTNLEQVYLPENVIILNLENYAKAQPADIAKDWDVLERALEAKRKLNIISSKRLMTARAVERSTNSASPDAVSSNMTPRSEITRTKDAPFRGKPVPSDEMLKAMATIIESSMTDRVTQNSYNQTKLTYNRPNRRRPEDLNLQGKITTKQYRPDIHIYLDTSGSVNETQYRDAVTNLILLTKKLDANIYITSFSDYITETSLLLTKGRSLTDVYKQFLAIPKANGGTDFENVWQKIDMVDTINNRSGQSYQINFVVTDFAYILNKSRRWSDDQASVKNTFYVPVSVEGRNWEFVKKHAKKFVEQMRFAGDASIRQRMIM